MFLAVAIYAVMDSLSAHSPAPARFLQRGEDMAREIERKFLVINDQWQSAVVAKHPIRQGYLAQQQGVSVRVRLRGEQGWLTIKGPTTGISRQEYEYPIPAQQAHEMLDTLATSGIIEKIRYQVRHHQQTWEVDTFLGRNSGLLIAEIELESEQQPFDLPPWVGDEVSQDPRYFNARLADHPYQEWSQEA